MAETWVYVWATGDGRYVTTEGMDGRVGLSGDRAEAREFSCPLDARSILVPKGVSLRATRPWKSPSTKAPASAPAREVAPGPAPGTGDDIGPEVELYLCLFRYIASDYDRWSDFDIEFAQSFLDRMERHGSRTRVSQKQAKVMREMKGKALLWLLRDWADESGVAGDIVRLVLREAGPKRPPAEDAFG